MSIEVRLPQLAEGMTAARLAAWLKREGERVTAGEPIAEVETDKTNVELEAPGSGVLGPIQVAAGTEAVAVGALLATIVPARQENQADRQTAAAVADEGGPQARSRGSAGEAPAPTAAAAAAPAGAVTARSVEPPRGVRATPLAARMARLAGVDLAAVHPANAGEPITRADLEAMLHRPPDPPRDADRGRSSQVPLSAMRRVTAARLQQAKQEIPHFYLQADCGASALTALRARLNAGRAGSKVTITDLLVLIVAHALQKVPAGNSSWADGGVRLHESIDIAVAVNTPKGLIAPVLRGCGRKSLQTISSELRGLAERARSGQLRPADYADGTFTISNLGMYGVTAVTPIINPPQSCILGVGAIERRPVVAEGALAIGEIMSCTLAADHRAIDGATGAELLAEIRRLIEDPMSILLSV